MIVVVSAQRDLHAMRVLEELQRRGAAATLLDLGDHPQRSHLSFAFPGAHFSLGDLDLSQVRAVWWRRPQPFVLHDEVRDANDRAFAWAELDAAFNGLWLSLDAFWINHPSRDEEASRKVYQLKIAEEIGLRIPRTCITTDPRAARAFAAEHNPTIYKAFGGMETAWRETRLLKPDEAERLDHVRFAPVIFQEYMRGVDLRITVVGDAIFPAAIHIAPQGYPVDFRMTMEHARIEAVTLPASLTAQLHAFVQRLGLVYGAIDMRLTPDGEYVFFEVNPSGQWLFIEDAAALPITAALARALVNG